MNDWQSIVNAVCDKTQTCLEINGSVAVPSCGGACVLPQHFDHVASSIDRYALIEDVETWPSQVIVHVEKSRQASIEACCFAWSRLAVGGHLLVVGPNTLGIKSTIKQLETRLRSASELLNNKRKARVHRFVKPENAVQLDAEITWQEVAADQHSERRLWTRAGVFSADALDDATALLQEQMMSCATPQCVLDMACGSGHLGMYALHLWSQVAVDFLDADARAVSACEKNIMRYGMQDRAQVQWWSAGTALPTKFYDLIVMNPPAHIGKEATGDIAMQMFEQAFAVLQPGGQLLIVANRQLPYEQTLKQLSPRLHCLAETGVFKILQLIKGEA